MVLANGALVTRMKDMMSENLSEGFRKFELDFAEKMGKEVRVENSRLDIVNFSSKDLL